MPTLLAHDVQTERCMGTEIERKWIVPPTSAYSAVERMIMNIRYLDKIEQLRQNILFAGKTSMLRVRATKGSEGRNADLTLKMKGSSSFTRAEYILPIPYFLGNLFFRKKVEIEKERITVWIDKWQVSLDYFKGCHEGLVFAEIEFDSEDEARSFEVTTIDPCWIETKISNSEIIHTKSAQEVMDLHEKRIVG